MSILREFPILERGDRSVTLCLHDDGGVTLAVEDPSSVAIVELRPDEVDRLAAAVVEVRS